LAILTTTPSTVLFRLSAGADDRGAAIDAAASALAAGRLAVLPTETVYGVGASAASAEGVAALTAATSAGGLAPVRPAAWHAPSYEVAREILRPTAPIHRRLMSRLLPGPVTFLLVKPREELEQIRERLGAIPGTLHDGREIAVRIPDQAVGRAVLESAWKSRAPVVAQGVAAAGWGTGHRLDEESIKSMLSGERPVGAVLDDGPTRYGGPSTTVRLKPDGWYEIVVAGAIPERIVRRQLERTVLFVCTGNTCRSPMAETIAMHLARPAREAPGLKVSTIFRSAGITAGGGEPAAQEAFRALQRMRIDPAHLAHHRSRELTRQAIAEAEIIYAMTGAHARAVIAMDPTAAPRVQVLDPEGKDIPDPLGHSLEVYSGTAERLVEAIRHRLHELEVL
jgi:protein-tyrosine phosphatase